ncbi:MAG: helix-turn-helix transcriptional regulator [Pseudomonadota bacterium]
MSSSMQHPSCARIAQHIGEILLVHRTKKGFTQAYVAEQVGLKRASSITRFEQGKTTPALDTLIHLTILLDIDPNKFFHGLVLPDTDGKTEESPPLSLEELRTLVEPFSDPHIRKVVQKNIHQIDDPDAAEFVDGLIAETENSS